MTEITFEIEYILEDGMLIPINGKSSVTHDELILELSDVVNMLPVNKNIKIKGTFEVEL